LVPPILERREVEVPDGGVDQLPVLLAVERARGHLLRRHEREVGDLGADLLQRALRLGLDLPSGLLEPPLPVSLDLLPDAVALSIGDSPGLDEDLLGLAARLPDQLAVLLDELPRFLARAIG